MMCKWIRCERNWDEYTCIYINEEGLEEEVAKGDEDQMILFLRENGMDNVSRDLIRMNTGMWCRDSKD